MASFLSIGFFDFIPARKNGNDFLENRMLKANEKAWSSIGRAFLCYFLQTDTLKRILHCSNARFWRKIFNDNSATFLKQLSWLKRISIQRFWQANCRFLCILSARYRDNIPNFWVLFVIFLAIIGRPSHPQWGHLTLTYSAWERSIISCPHFSQIIFPLSCYLLDSKRWMCLESLDVARWNSMILGRFKPWVPQPFVHWDTFKDSCWMLGRERKGCQSVFQHNPRSQSDDSSFSKKIETRTKKWWIKRIAE